MSTTSVRVVDAIGSIADNIIPPSYVCSYSALAVPAYWRAINFIAENIASFPKSVRQDGAKLTDTPHPLERLLKRRPNAYQNAFNFFRTLTAHAAHIGGGFAFIERDPMTKQPLALHNIRPEAVYPFRWTPEGETTPSQFYMVTPTQSVIGAADMIHLQSLSWDGFRGIDPVLLHESTLQRALTLDRYQTRFLQKGSVIRGSIEIPDGVPDEKIRMIQETIRQFFRGPDAERDVVVLGNGAKLNNATLSPQQSQLIEQTSATVKQISQITGVDPAYLFERSDSRYTGIEEAGESIVRYLFRPWLAQVEAELSMKLLSESDQDAGYHAHIDPEALQRGNTAAMNAAAVSTKNAGIRTPNEARQMLGEPPLEDSAANELHTLGDSTPPAADTAKPV